MSTAEPAVRARPAEVLNVQGLRAVAVLLVMFMHLRDAERIYRPDPVLPVWADIGHAGVDLFFVISGFIMVLIGHAYPATARAAGRFLYHRWARIYPTYWVWFLISLAIYLTAPAWLRLAPGKITHLVESFFLIPTWTEPLVLVSWTLKYEIYFYLVFAAVILLPQRWRIPALLLWALYMLIGQQFCYSAPDVLCHKALFLTMHPLAFEFLFGAAIAWLYLRSPLRRPLPVLLLGLCLLIGGFLWFVLGGVSLNANSWNRVLLFGLPAAVMLYGAVELERARGPMTPRWLVAIGNASYSIYLSHFLVLLVLFKAFASQSLVPTPLMTGGILVVALGIGLLAHRWVEQPLLDLSRGRWRRATLATPKAAA
ncbi:acyltransferase family protein [Thiocapsa roseopersicina]|uniref:Peptidoglycan/LPS O-acetylase OafA/YrhL, contains acyltransferase and SGNH-hydrolase domains n=1 Tax=Thiocapsa roseopersicina TaxID=1058 RepID=A0A1H2V246_THIRO|nr:acyltransferase [Thiocapsa roseopersicina]SDW62350.1 Peptidoglycan/LPS O-acetylase OafA/YrhL, contains acyltransferase and SGNH-hydrolase domains [Thiocapsa roseopersicina]